MKFNRQTIGEFMIYSFVVFCILNLILSAIEVFPMDETKARITGFFFIIGITGYLLKRIPKRAVK